MSGRAYRSRTTMLFEEMAQTKRFHRVNSPTTKEMQMTDQFNAYKGVAENGSGTIVATRKKLGTNTNLTDDDVVLVGGGHMTVRDALKEGILFRRSDGVLAENMKASAATRVNS